MEETDSSCSGRRMLWLSPGWFPPESVRLTEAAGCLNSSFGSKQIDPRKVGQHEARLFPQPGSAAGLSGRSGALHFSPCPPSTLFHPFPGSVPLCSSLPRLPHRVSLCLLFSSLLPALSSVWSPLLSLGCSFCPPDTPAPPVFLSPLTSWHSHFGYQYLIIQPIYGLFKETTCLL